MDQIELILRKRVPPMSPDQARWPTEKPQYLSDVLELLVQTVVDVIHAQDTRSDLQREEIDRLRKKLDGYGDSDRPVFQGISG